MYSTLHTNCVFTNKNKGTRPAIINEFKNLKNYSRKT